MKKFIKAYSYPYNQKTGLILYINISFIYSLNHFTNVNGEVYLMNVVVNGKAQQWMIEEEDYKNLIGTKL